MTQISSKTPKKASLGNFWVFWTLKVTPIDPFSSWRRRHRDKLTKAATVPMHSRIRSCSRCWRWGPPSCGRPHERLRSRSTCAHSKYESWVRYLPRHVIQPRGCLQEISPRSEPRSGSRFTLNVLLIQTVFTPLFHCNWLDCSGETNPRIGIRRFESFCEFCGRARRFESQSQGF
jgi:hypothetical protein